MKNERKEASPEDEPIPISTFRLRRNRQIKDGSLGVWFYRIGNEIFIPLEGYETFDVARLAALDLLLHSPNCKATILGTQLTGGHQTVLGVHE